MTSPDRHCLGTVGILNPQARLVISLSRCCVILGAPGEASRSAGSDPDLKNRSLTPVATAYVHRDTSIRVESNVPYPLIGMTAGMGLQVRSSCSIRRLPGDSIQSW